MAVMDCAVNGQVAQIIPVGRVVNGRQFNIHIALIIADTFGGEGIRRCHGGAALGFGVGCVGKGHRLLVGLAEGDHAHLEGELDFGIGRQRTLPLHHLLRRCAATGRDHFQLGLQGASAAGWTLDDNILDSAAVDGRIDNQWIGQHVAHTYLHRLSAAILAQADLIGDIVDPFHWFTICDDLLQDFQCTGGCRRGRALQDIFGFTMLENLEGWVFRMRATTIGQGCAAGWLHRRRFAQGKAHPMATDAAAVEDFFGGNRKVEGAAGGNGRHVDDVVLHNPFIAGLGRLIFIPLALTEVGPVTIAIAVKPDIEVHAVERGIGRLTDAHL